MQIGPYYRTVRHLRPSQVFWRLRYAVERRAWLRPHKNARWGWRGNRLPRVRPDFPQVPRFARSRSEGAPIDELLAQGEFRHLNWSRQLGREQPNWQLGPVTADRLWTITLHYHAWAHELAEVAAAGDADAGRAATLFRHYVSDWIHRCGLDAPGARQLAWNAFAIATRLSWWIRAYHRLSDSPHRLDGPLQKQFLSSLWQQAAYLRHHVEWDLRGNHLLRNAVGLAWAGRFFDEAEAQEWLATARRLAEQQAVEQVLPDGGHFERSPMYHIHAMEDLLSLALLVEDRQVSEQLRERWQQMAQWLAWMRHPDGEIPLFNDGGLGAVCDPAQMLHLGESLSAKVETQPRGGRYFPDTGMVVWHGEPWTVFFDVGRVGPDYQPGHAHADTLSIECSCHGQRFIVDPGTYGYDHDERRRYDRSTAAHNTVCIDGADSSEVWHIFRVGRRAYPVEVDARFDDGAMNAIGSHNGYDHLPGRPRHSRRLRADRDGSLRVTDVVRGKGRHVIEGGFLIGPQWQVHRNGESGWTLRNGEHAVQLNVRGPKSLRLIKQRRPYHPEYGREVQTHRLAWRVEESLPLEVTTQLRSDT